MSEAVANNAAGPVRRFGRRLFKVAVFLLVLCTVYVSVGRLLLPVLTTQKDQIETRLSQLLGTQVSIGRLEGNWFRFSPGFEISDLSLLLNPQDSASTFNLGHAELALDLLSSVRSGQLSLSHLKFSQLELALEQTDSGRWTLLGLVPGERDYKNRIMDFLLTTPFIVIDEASLLVRLADGHEVRLQSVYLQLENLKQSHQLSLQFRLGEQNSPAHALLDLQGDPRSGFNARLWLGIEDMDMQQVVPLLSGNLHTDASSGAGQFWFSLNDSGLTSVTARLDNLTVLGNFGEAQYPLLLNSAAMSLVATRQDQEQQNASAVWKFAVSDLVFDWDNTPWEVPRLNLDFPLDANAAWQIQAESLDVALLTDIALSLPLPRQARSALETLLPTGNLRSVVLESDRSGGYPDGFLLKSNFEQVAVAAWGGAPAGSGLNGYTEVSASKGLAAVSSNNASIYLPNLFREPWQYQQLNTQVNWSVQNGDVLVSSTPIAVSNEFLQGRVQFSLHNTRLDETESVSDFTLLVGMDYMEVATHSAYLPTLEKLAPTMKWLDTALQGGRIVNSGFVLRTPAGKNTVPTSATQASWFRVQQGQLQFLPEWPLVNVNTAGVIVRDQETDIIGSAASIGGLPVQDVQAQIRPVSTGGSLLTLQAKAETSTAAGMDFLRTTPVREYVGAALDNWDASGMLALEVTLGIPLGSNHSQQQIAVNALSQNSTLHINDYSLDISAINGLITYHQDSGLQAEELSAQMFAYPVKIAIATAQDGSAGARTIKVRSEGRSSVAELAAWKGQPDFVRGLLGYTQGEVAYKAGLDIPGKGQAEAQPNLQIQADLLDMSSVFPVPFLKSADEPAQLQLDMAFAKSGQTIVLRYNDWLSGQLVLDADGIDRGQLYFGKLNQSFNIRQTNASAEGLLINGELQEFSYEEWQKVADHIAEQNQSGAKSLKDYLRLIDVNIDHLQVAGQNFEDINVQVQHKDAAWQIFGQNKLLAGNLMVPDAADQSWDINLDYLRFPPREVPDPDATVDEATEEEEEIDMLQDVDPSALPAFTFKTAELSIGESNLGSFSFALKPEAQGALVSDFIMQEEASNISGIAPGSGAGIDWRYQNGIHSSHFTGVFTAGDLAKVMPKWGHDAHIISRQARFDGELSWPGSPLAFTLKKATGDISLSINNGRFVDIDSGSSKLLGAFNFDALVRRLELDFSDLYERGFAYDTIKGELVFTDGVVQTKTPLIIDGPSSRLNIQGQISLPAETIAADMQVRIPLGENISMLAGLLGAWPIALSTYLASKIFSEQVEDFTTIIYRLEGPWDNPQAGFEAPEEEVHE